MTTTSTLTTAERLKFRLLSDGLVLSAEAREYIDAATGHRPMTPADYASTSGVILALEDEVWVNAPFADHNPNFVTAPRYTLDLDDHGLVVRGDDLESTARFWLPPDYHEQVNRWGEAFTSYAFTHADRVRISPIEGCALACKFCDLPYEFRYRTKRVEGLVDAVQRALEDPTQPAHHILISGGTPRPADFGYMREVYDNVISFAADRGVAVDIMMVPYDEVLDAAWLDGLGVSELSVNIELFNEERAKQLMPRKAARGVAHYLDFLEAAAEILGEGRVRSMLMVGLEPLEDTLAGVAAIAQRGCVPVLSPFRPDPSTPLASLAPPSSDVLEEAYLRARDVVSTLGSRLGPTCVPCTHNTLTFAQAGNGDANGCHGSPLVV